MEEAVIGLRNRDTGDEVQSAQRHAIQLLMGALKGGGGGKEGGKKSSSPSPSLASMMSSLVDEGPAGLSGGGSDTGGRFDAENLRVTGETKGGPKEREMKKGMAGTSREEMPVEYRRLLEEYFRKRQEMTP